MEFLMNLVKTPPKWMDQSFFEKVVRQMEDDPQAQVKCFDVTSGAKPGENFASAIFRALITFSSKSNDAKTISTIIKVQLELPPEMAHMVNPVSFRNEMEMYDKVLPAVQSVWSAAGSKEILCPKMIYQSTEPVPVIVLEDLCGSGFSVIQKPPEDFEVSKRVVRRLADFHAATFLLAEEKKLNFTDFNFTIFNDPMTQGLMVQAFAPFIEVAKDWDGFDEFLPRLEVFKDGFLEKVKKTYAVNKSEFGFNVLNHADFHVKNMLFKKTEDGGVDDFYIIDYQICDYATPAIDLIYTLYFFTSTENRQKHRAELIAIYHQQFVDSLKKFGYLETPPSLTDLQVEMLRNGSLEVVVAICMCIFFFVDFSKFAEMGIEMDVTKPGEGLKAMYRVPGFKETIAQEFPRWVYNGFI